jgi:probable blue pigment (indigoidine) exporter
MVFARSVNRGGGLHPLIVTTVSMGIGSVALLLTGLAIQGLPRLSAREWAIIAWLAVVNTAVTFTAWNYTLRHLSAAESSTINGTMMIWIPILAVVFLGETITPRELVGLVAAALGTLLVQLRSPAPFLRGSRRAAPDEP